MSFYSNMPTLWEIRRIKNLVNTSIDIIFAKNRFIFWQIMIFKIKNDFREEERFLKSENFRTCIIYYVFHNSSSIFRFENNDLNTHQSIIELKSMYLYSVIYCSVHFSRRTKKHLNLSTSHIKRIMLAQNSHEKKTK